MLIHVSPIQRTLCDAGLKVMFSLISIRSIIVVIVYFNLKLEDYICYTVFLWLSLVLDNLLSSVQV